MSDRFTSEFRQALILALNFAIEQQHDSVGIDHLLIALASDPNFSSAKILKLLTITREYLINEMDELRMRSKKFTVGEIQLTAEARKVIELAVRTSIQHRNPVTDTEHLLLGIVLHAQSDAARVLYNRGVRLETLRLLVQGLRENPL